MSGRARRWGAAALAGLALGLLVGCGGAAQQAPEVAPAVPVGMTPEQVVQENLDMGVALFDAQRLTDAQDAFLKVLAVDSRHARALAYLGRIALAVGEPERAMEYADAALAVDPKDADMIRMKVGILRAQKREDEALALIDRSAALFSSPEDAPKAKEFRTDRLEILNARGDYMGAIKEGKDLLFVDPDNARAMREIGRGYVGLKRPGLARYVFKEALERGTDGRVHFYLGNLANDDGDYKLAIHHYEQAVAADPSLAAAFNNLAMLNQKAGNHRDAIRNLESALALRPAWHEARVNLANSYRHLKQYKEAEALYMEVAQAAPDMPEVYFNLGVLYLENEVEGYEPIDRYGLAAKNFASYRDKMGSKLGADDPALKYIKEAQTLQQQIRDMQEQMRMMEQMQQQQEQEPASEGEGGAEGTEGGAGMEGDDAAAATDEAADGALPDAAGEPVDSLLDDAPAGTQEPASDESGAGAQDPATF